MKRALKWALGVVGALALLIAITLPMYADYTPRARVVAAIAYVLAAREGLQEACNNDTFGAVRSVLELGVGDGATPSRVEKLELVRMSPSVVRLKATLQEIHARPFYGLLAVQAIPPGRVLEYEFTCGSDKAVSRRFVGTSIDPKYLPSSLRAP